MSTLVIRADSNVNIGTGHVMRCLALAQAWQDNGGTVTFLMAPGSSSLEQRICSEGITVLPITEQPGSNDDAANTAEIAKKNESSWVVVDGYHFGGNYQNILKEQNCRILFIDDFGHADHYYADIVLNQNIYAEPSIYKNLEPYTRLLLGTRYALLRKEFLKFSGWKREIPAIAHKVLVTLGGGDPQNVTQKVIESLKMVQIYELEVIILISSANTNYSELKKTIQNFPKFKIINNSADISELMAWADIVISAGGSTNLELAFMGLPAITINIAENQVLNSQVLGKNSIVKNLGWYENVNPERICLTVTQVIQSQKMRTIMSELGKKIVDGNGARYVTECMRCKP